MVLPFLRAHGVNSLAGLILTHGDAQHIGGTLSLLDDFHPALVIDSGLKDRSSVHRSIQTALAQRGHPKRLVQRGDTLPLAEGLSFSVLYPPQGLERASADDKALVVRIERPGGRALFMSDSGFTTEQWLLENEPDLQAEILVKGEHDKDFSGGADFLRRVSPRTIIVSAPDPYAPARNRDRWAREVRSRGIELFRQEESGGVRVKVMADGIEAQGFVNGQVFRSH